MFNSVYIVMWYDTDPHTHFQDVHKVFRTQKDAETFVDENRNKIFVENDGFSDYKILPVVFEYELH